MLFNSIDFLIFFPLVVLVYFVIPDKIKHVWLLVASYYFYMCWNAQYALLILTSTVVTYFSGRIIEKIKQSSELEAKKTRNKKLVVFFSFAINLGILFYFKYSNFALSLVSSLFRAVHIEVNIPTFDIILPVGISFYTFQALSYTMDVYRDEIYAEKDFLRYALFVSFFPQLVAGPIERSKNLLKQLAKPSRFDYERMWEGILLMLWGFFLKIVIADRIAMFVDTVYNEYDQYTGWYIIIATVLFGFQIYCDFNGYSVIAIGAARVLGINLMENFNAPYLSESVAEFWKNWHISLTSWFRDYLYIPLGGNRKGKARKYLNQMIVFLLSGLWHGASLSFVLWGGLNGLYQVVGDLLKNVRAKCAGVLGIDGTKLANRAVKCIVTFALVDFAWLFFRADSLKSAISMIRQMCDLKNTYVLFDGSIYSCGLDEKNYHLVLICLVILFVADLLKKKGIIIRQIVMKQDLWFRCIFVAAAVAFILTFGIWGGIYEEATFIYFQF